MWPWGDPFYMNRADGIKWIPVLIICLIVGKRIHFKWQVWQLKRTMTKRKLGKQP